MSNETRARGRGHTFTLKEEIDLIVGYNTYGSGNWSLIFNDSRLCFKSFMHRKRVHLCPKWRNLKKKCIFKNFFFLPGKKEECRPLPYRESGKKQMMDDENEFHPVVYHPYLEGAVIIDDFEMRAHENGFIFSFMDHGSERRLFFKEVRAHFVRN